MATKADLQYVANEVGITLTDKQLDAMTRDTPCSGYSIQLAIDELLMTKNPGPKHMKQAFKNSARPQPTEKCNVCRERYIPILDVHTHKSLGYPVYHNITTIPRAHIGCPNCSTQAAYAQRRINNMSDEDASWTWVLIYNYVIFHLQQLVAPQNFNPNEYWGGININPALSLEQTGIMNWIFATAQNRGTDPAPIELTRVVQNLAHNVAQQTTIPF